MFVLPMGILNTLCLLSQKHSSILSVCLSLSPYILLALPFHSGVFVQDHQPLSLTWLSVSHSRCFDLDLHSPGDSAYCLDSHSPLCVHCPCLSLPLCVCLLSPICVNGVLELCL